MALSQKLSEVDLYTTYVVCGYIKQVEKELKLKHITFDAIVPICILYYYQDEVFDLTGYDVTKSNEGRCITKKLFCFHEDWNNNNHGFIKIHSMSSGVFTWTLKIKRMKYFMILGVADLNYTQVHDGDINDYAYYYAIMAGSGFKRTRIQTMD